MTLCDRKTLATNLLPYTQQSMFSHQRSVIMKFFAVFLVCCALNSALAGAALSPSSDIHRTINSIHVTRARIFRINYTLECLIIKCAMPTACSLSRSLISACTLMYYPAEPSAWDFFITALAPRAALCVALWLYEIRWCRSIQINAQIFRMTWVKEEFSRRLLCATLLLGRNRIIQINVSQRALTQFSWKRFSLNLQIEKWICESSSNALQESFLLI